MMCDYEQTQQTQQTQRPDSATTKKATYKHRPYASLPQQSFSPRENGRFDDNTGADDAVFVAQVQGREPSSPDAFATTTGRDQYPFAGMDTMASSDSTGTDWYEPQQEMQTQYVYNGGHQYQHAQTYDDRTAMMMQQNTQHHVDVYAYEAQYQPQYPQQLPNYQQQPSQAYDGVTRQRHRRQQDARAGQIAQLPPVLDELPQVVEDPSQWRDWDVKHQLAAEPVWAKVRESVRRATSPDAWLRLGDVLRDFPNASGGRRVPSAAARNNVPVNGKFAHQLATCILALDLSPMAECEPSRTRWCPKRRGWERVFVGQCPQEYGPVGLGAVVRQLVFADVPDVQWAQVTIDARAAPEAVLFVDASNGAALFSIETAFKEKTCVYFVSAPVERTRELQRLSGHVLCHPTHVTVHSVKYMKENAKRGSSELHKFLRDVEKWQESVGITSRPLKPMTFQPQLSNRNN